MADEEKILTDHLPYLKPGEYYVSIIYISASILFGSLFLPIQIETIDRMQLVIFSLGFLFIGIGEQANHKIEHSLMVGGPPIFYLKRGWTQLGKLFDAIGLILILIGLILFVIGLKVFVIGFLYR